MRYILVMLLSCSFSVAAFTQGEVLAAPSLEPATVRPVTPEGLSAMLAEGQVHVFDCNEPETHEYSHIPGSVLIVYDEVTQDKLPADLSAVLVFYCYSPECPAASMAAKDAVKLGHTSVYCMEAGIIGWEDAGLPTEAGQ